MYLLFLQVSNQITFLSAYAITRFSVIGCIFIVVGEQWYFGREQ